MAEPRQRTICRSFAAFIAASVCGCGTPGDKLAPIAESRPADYTLGAGDQVRVVTFGEPALSGEFRIGDAGGIAIPLIGTVPAAGLSPDRLAKLLISDVTKAQLMKEPKIAVEVLQYRPVFILGEVSKPGQYAYQPGMTVVTAVAIAGGFTYRAVKNEFSIVRPPIETASNTPPAAPEQATEGRAERQTAVLPGDVITVYERYF